MIERDIHNPTRCMQQLKKYQRTDMRIKQHQIRPFIWEEVTDWKSILAGHASEAQRINQSVNQRNASGEGLKSESSLNHCIGGILAHGLVFLHCTSQSVFMKHGTQEAYPARTNTLPSD